MATISSITAKADPVWTTTTKLPKYPKLRKSLDADVCIVGAGIAGLTTAYSLCQRGKTVVVLDDGGIASGMTAVTTAHLANAIDDRYFEIERLHGQRGAQLAAESHTAAIQSIEAIVQQEQIDCEFERLDGYLFLSPSEDHEFLRRELEAAHRAGLADVESLDCVPCDGLDAGPCLRFPHQAQFHPLKYLGALARAIERKGGLIFNNTHADRIEGGSAAFVQAGRHRVSAHDVVVATNAPVNNLVAIHTKQAPYMTYVIGARVPSGLVPKGLYWDTGDPYHYVRLQRIERGRKATNGRGAYELLIVGGEDHKSGQAEDTEERHVRLEEWARERFPFMEEVEYKWGGQVMETVDGLAYIGRNPLDRDHTFVVTGDSGMGMTHGTIAGMLITDLILGQENPWESLYDPGRKTLGATGEYLKEALNTAAQYTDWLTGGDVKSVDDIAAGSGAVIRSGLTKHAVYRDENGAVHACSAVCPHLGCIVQWNQAESTWDCPCHGSRFDNLGKAINGPANKPLAPVESK